MDISAEQPGEDRCCDQEADSAGRGTDGSVSEAVGLMTTGEDWWFYPRPYVRIPQGMTPLQIDQYNDELDRAILVDNPLFAEKDNGWISISHWGLHAVNG
jgi:hypothetical protein